MQRRTASDIRQWQRRYQPATAELLLTGCAIVVYFLIRASHPDNIHQSVRRSLAIVRLEDRLGVFHEASIQQWFLPHEWLIDVANTVYVWGMYPVLVAVALWLAFSDLNRFRYIRNVMLMSACLGIAGYWLIPAAPPRLLALYGFNYGFVDTLHQGTGAVQDYQPGFFQNPYAALPSFHFAWVALAGIAVWTNTRNHWVRLGAALFCTLMFWAIIVTANHFFFDLLLGVLTVAIAWLLTAGLYRLRDVWRREPVRERSQAGRWRGQDA